MDKNGETEMSEPQKSENGKKNPNTSAALAPTATAAKERKAKRKAVRLKDVASGAAGVRWNPRHSNQVLDRISRNVGLVPENVRKLVIRQVIEMLQADLEGGEVVLSVPTTPAQSA